MNQRYGYSAGCLRGGFGGGFRGGLVVLLSAVLLFSACSGGEIVFSDVPSQSRQFMDWERTIPLSTEQEAVKKAALTAMPAPCCSDSSAYTCCCSCNVSRTIWGLSNYLIAKQGKSVKQVREKVSEWIKFVNPEGYSGDSCYRGGCPRAFKDNGCGGMKANHLVL